MESIFAATRLFSEQQNPEKPALGEFHFDPRTLDVISDIIDQLRRGEIGGCRCPEENWNCVHQPVHHAYDPVRAREDVKAARDAEAQAETLVLAANVMKKIQGLVLLQAEASRSRARALQMRAGLSSLPDEVLMLILELVICDESDIHGYGCAAYGLERSALRIYTAAGNLSLTCRRFRYLITHDSSIWCCISSGMDSNVVSTLCDRLKRANAEILFHLYASPLEIGTKIDQFFHAIAAHSRYWRRFHQCNCIFHSSSIYEVLGTARKTRNIDVPSLTHLTVEFPSMNSEVSPTTVTRVGPNHAAVHYFSSWTLPRLTHFAIHNLAPIPFKSSPPNLTSFTIELEWETTGLSVDHYADILKALIAFLESCFNLKEFKMSVSLLESDIYSPMGQRSTALPSVDVLKLNFFRCEAPLVRSFFDTVRFPNASSLDLEIYTSKSEGTPAQDLLTAVLSNSTSTPCSSLKNLKLVIEIGRYAPVKIVFPSLPAVEDLTLSLEGYIGFSFQDGPCLLSLRSLSFEDSSMLEVDDVRNLLVLLEKQGNVPELTVTNCQWLDSEGYDVVDGYRVPAQITASEMLSMIM